MNNLHALGQLWSYTGSVKHEKHQCFCTVYLMMNSTKKAGDTPGFDSGVGYGPVFIKFEVAVGRPCFPILGWQGTKVCQDECLEYYKEMLKVVRAWNKAMRDSEKKHGRRGSHPPVKLPKPRTGAGVVVGSSKSQQAYIEIKDGQPVLARSKDWMPFDWKFPIFVNSMTLLDVESSCRPVVAYAV